MQATPDPLEIVSTLPARHPASRPRAHRDAPELRRGFASREEQQRVFEWLEAGLRPGRPGRLRREYPLVFDGEAACEHFILLEHDTPLAHCALLPRTLRVARQRLRIGLLSLVFTSPAARGRGHASRVVRAAVEHAERSGLGLVLLWSERDSLYERQGFEPAGREMLLVLEPKTLERALADDPVAFAHDAAADLVLREACRMDWEAIARLRRERETGLVEGERELGALRALPDLDVRVASRQGRLVAFAMRGRGDDLRQIVHEWGGEVAGVLRCCQALQQDGDAAAPLLLLSPADRNPLAWACRRAGAPAIRQPLAWMRITSVDALARDLAPLRIGRSLARTRPKTDESLPAAAGFAPRFEPTTPGDLRCLAQRTLLAALFGTLDPRESERERRKLEEFFGVDLAKELPLPCFVWGLESI